MAKRSTIVFTLVLCLYVLAAIGFVIAVATFPPISMSRMPSGGPEPGTNWVGNETPVIWIFAGLLLATTYVCKRLITTSLPSKSLAWLLYAELIACSLPLIWFFIAMDWGNEHVFPISCWVYDPIAVWMVPTVSFVIDMERATKPSTRHYVIRSLVELIIFVPAWCYCWLFFSFFALHGGWI